MVTPISTIHPNKNLAYKISFENKKFIYLTDFAHYKEENDKIIEFSMNSDLIIYDANFTPEEYEMKIYEGWGHSHWLNAVNLANDSHSKKLILFHHKVDRTDSELEKILEQSRKYFKNTYLAKEEDEYIL
jgi:ribonuclease BN (tRNA processing enzyme)